MVEAIRTPELTVKFGFSVGFSKVKKRFGDIPPLFFILPGEVLPEVYVGQLRGSNSTNGIINNALYSSAAKAPAKGRIRRESSLKRGVSWVDFHAGRYSNSERSRRQRLEISLSNRKELLIL